MNTMGRFFLALAGSSSRRSRIHKNAVKYCNGFLCLWYHLRRLLVSNSFNEIILSKDSFLLLGRTGIGLNGKGKSGSQVVDLMQKSRRGGVTVNSQAKNSSYSNLFHVSCTRSNYPWHKLHGRLARMCFKYPSIVHASLSETPYFWWCAECPFQWRLCDVRRTIAVTPPRNRRQKCSR